MGRIERREFAYRLPKQGGVIDLMDGIFQLIFRMDAQQTEKGACAYAKQVLERVHPQLLYRSEVGSAG